MQYTRIESEPLDEGSRRIRNLFRDIEKKGRLAGNTDLLMELDRIPGLVLGASNRQPAGALDAANANALEALERITESLSSHEDAEH